MKDLGKIFVEQTVKEAIKDPAKTTLHALANCTNWSIETPSNWRGINNEIFFPDSGSARILDKDGKAFAKVIWDTSFKILGSELEGRFIEAFPTLVWVIQYKRVCYKCGFPNILQNPDNLHSGTWLCTNKKCGKKSTSHW